MGLKGKLRHLEDRAQAIAAETQEDEKLERERAIMRMIVDEFARLKASGEPSDGDPPSAGCGQCGRRTVCGAGRGVVPIHSRRLDRDAQGVDPP
jgi:hypothetical protein